MDVYKAKIQSDGTIDKLKLRIVVRGDLHNKEMVGGTWSLKVLMEAVGDQVSSTISLFCRSPLTKILNFNLSSWILVIQIILRNMQSTLEEP